MFLYLSNSYESSVDPDPTAHAVQRRGRNWRKDFQVHRCQPTEVRV